MKSGVFVTKSCKYAEWVPRVLRVAFNCIPNNAMFNFTPFYALLIRLSNVAPHQATKVYFVKNAFVRKNSISKRNIISKTG